MKRDISDLGLAAFLSASGHKLLGVERNGQRGVFIFQNNSEIEKDTLAYFNNEARVCPLTYHETLKNLKMLVMNQR